MWVYRIMCSGAQEQEDATEEHAHEDQQQPKQEKQDIEEVSFDYYYLISENWTMKL